MIIITNELKNILPNHSISNFIFFQVYNDKMKLPKQKLPKDVIVYILFLENFS